MKTSPLYSTEAKLRKRRSREFDAAESAFSSSAIFSSRSSSPSSSSSSSPLLIAFFVASIWWVRDQTFEVFRRSLKKNLVFFSFYCRQSFFYVFSSVNSKFVRKRKRKSVRRNRGERSVREKQNFPIFQNESTHFLNIFSHLKKAKVDFRFSSVGFEFDE